MLFSASDIQPQLLCLTFKILSHPFLPVVQGYLQYKASTPRQAVYPPPAERLGASLFHGLDWAILSARTLFVCPLLPEDTYHPQPTWSIFTLSRSPFILVCLYWAKIMIRLATFSQFRLLPVGHVKRVKVRTWISFQLLSFDCTWSVLNQTVLGT